MRKCIVLLLTVFCSLAAFANNSITTKNAELTRVSNQIQQLQKTITLNQQQQQQLETELQNTEVAIGNLGLQVNQLNQAITQEQLKLAKLKATQQISLDKLAQQHIALAQQMRATYQLDSLQPLKVILNQNNPNT